MQRSGIKERSTPPRQSAARRTDVVEAAEFLRMRSFTGDMNVSLGTHVVPLTSLDKLYWREEGFTKGVLLQYYAGVADVLLPYLHDRPLILKRYPNGIEGKHFYQHDIGSAPKFVRTVPLLTDEGRTVDYIVCNNPATLLWVVNMGAIDQHPWNARIASLDFPDWMVFDLDPKEAPFEVVCEVALAVRSALEQLGLRASPKTSGSRGIHLYVPLKPHYAHEEVAAIGEQVAGIVARQNPAIATVERSLAKRRAGQVYIDYLQNARGKAVAAPYTVRPRRGATVSTPLEWKEVERIPDPREFTLRTLPGRVKKKGDVFLDVLHQKQTLRGAA